MPGGYNYVIPFSIDISWFSNLFETNETERPWWIMCSYIRLGQSNRYWKNRSFEHPQAKLDILSFQKTYKWAMETRGPKSNLCELLCLSWLPATLMMIRSKMNELAWRHHNFPIISLWEIFYRAFMPVLVNSNFDDLIKNERASIGTAFSHYKSMGNFLDAQGQLTP